MQIAVIGTGYVGLPTGVGLAELGHQVVCIDSNERKIENLKKGIITLYEEGLDELYQKHLKDGHIKFTTSMEKAINNSDLVIIAVGTPPDPITHQADMTYVYNVATELADYLNNYRVIAIKSTVPVGTGDIVENLIRRKNPNAKFDLISLPEFLREGFAVHDFFNPDRIVVGTESQHAQSIIRNMYNSFQQKPPFLFVKRRSAEAIKYASNSFLAIKIHYINEIANFCEKTGADILEVSKGMGLDTRIGPKFLNAGPGYGGSCFPKDTMAMAFMGRENGVHLTLIENTIKQNKERKKQMAHRIQDMIQDIPDAKIAVWGLAFKCGTDDCRESPAVEIIVELIKNNGHITAYDPKAINTAKQLLGDKIQYADNMYDAVKGADVLAILTEWDEFKSLDLKRVSKLMAHKNIMDCRNLLDPICIIKEGFNYKGIGK